MWSNFGDSRHGPERNLSTDWSLSNPAGELVYSTDNLTVLKHKQQMLNQQYSNVVAVSEEHGGLGAQRELSPFLAAADEFTDPIANMALSVDDDLCIMQATTATTGGRLCLFAKLLEPAE